LVLLAGFPVPIEVLEDGFQFRLDALFFGGNKE